MEQVKCGACDKPARIHYRWAWGEEGDACTEHQALLEQTAEQVKRDLTVSPIAQGEAPLERSERQQLIAARLAAEGEAEDTKRRNSRLYDQNQKLIAEAERSRVLHEEAAAQVTDLKAEVASLNVEIARLSRELGQRVHELDRANVLLESADASEEVASLMGEVKQLEARLNDAAQEDAQMRERMAATADESGRLREENSKLRGEVDRLQNELNEANKQD